MNFLLNFLPSAIARGFSGASARWRAKLSENRMTKNGIAEQRTGSAILIAAAIAAAAILS